MAALKYSRQREAILENLRQRADHPTAEMIYEDIRTSYPNISLGTVYRNLSLLTELGEIIKLPAINGFERYDARTDLHDHLICRKCGTVFDLPAADHKALLHETQQIFDGTVESCGIRFYGICRSCQAAEASEEGI